MAYFHLETFKNGLDTRRNELTSLPGTLVTCQDAHITQGGEVQKRYALVYKAVPSTYYGLEALDAGLTVFGSKNAFGGAAPAQASALPSPFVYQQLKHPAVSVFGITYDAAYHEMTAVVDSESYLGKSLVLATFSDGYTFLFYDGTPVRESYTGIILHGYTLNTTSVPAATVNQDMVNGFLSIPGWNGIAFIPLAQGYYPELSWLTTATTVSFPDVGSGMIVAPAASTWSVVKTISGSGQLEFNLGATTAPAVAGTAASATYTVAGGGGDQYEVYIPVSSVSTNIRYWAAVHVNWAISDANTASLIVTAINAGTTRHGLTAANGGTAVVTVSAPIPILTTFGAYPNLAPAYTWPTMIVRKSGTGVARTFANGTSGIGALGQYDYFLFDSGWVEGDTWTVTVTSTGGTFTIGRGNLPVWKTGNTVAYPLDMYVFNTQVMLANGNYFNFSSPGNPAGWERQDTNAGFLPYTTQYGAQDTVQAFSTYQQQLAVFGRFSVQLWNWDALPANQSKRQTLSNIGTLAPKSVQGLGDLDVMFLADTGIRSLRARVASDNAFVNDIGSPVDTLVTPATSACSEVDPMTGRYWLYTSGKIFVLSYYPTNKIVAWSTYQPKSATSSSFVFTFTADMTIHSSITLSAYDGWTTNVIGSILNVSANQSVFAAAGLLTDDINARTLGYSAVDNGDGSVTITYTGYIASSSISALVVGSAPNSIGSVTEVFSTFTPQKMVTYQNRLYLRSSNAVYCYSGQNGSSYDTIQAQMVTPWLDGSRPDTSKGLNGVDGVISGSWQMQVGVDWIDESFQEVIAVMTQPSFDQGAIGVSFNGTHFAFKFVSTAVQAGASIAQVIVLYQPQNEPA